MPFALYALTVGAFGIGVTEFVIMGLLLEISTDFHISLQLAGLLISGYALGVAVGAPFLTVMTGRWPRKQILIALMFIFILGNAACALAPNYETLMVARILTSFAHGTFFGVGSVVATGLVTQDKRASAIALMFMGLTLANIVGVPFGTWLGQHYGWRATFWAVTAIGVFASVILSIYLPNQQAQQNISHWRDDFKVIATLPVLLGLLTTVFGFAGLFTVFTYIAPILTQITGFDRSAVSPILLVFGAGLVVGNLIGGKLADQTLLPTIIGSLVALALTLGVMSWVLASKFLMILFVGLLGATAFATVSPLQIWILEKAQGAGQALASSFNIAAFNLGNALGAWLGGLAIAQGMGLASLTWIAVLLPLLALLTVFIAQYHHNRSKPLSSTLNRPPKCK